MANLTAWSIVKDWTAITFTASELNSLASGGGALSTDVIANGTAGSLYADVSFVVTVGGTTTAASYLVLYVLPLNQDGTTYGDGYASSGSVQPVANPYAAASASIAVGITNGNTAVGMFRNVLLPPGSFKFALGQSLGVALSATAALTIKYRTYVENLNA